MFIKIVIQQANKILKLNRDNRVLEGRCREYREKMRKLESQRNNAKIVSENTIMNLLSIQEIEHLGISEMEKRIKRNIFINHLIKAHQDNIKELECLANKTSSSVTNVNS